MNSLTGLQNINNVVLRLLLVKILSDRATTQEKVRYFYSNVEYLNEIFPTAACQNSNLI